MMAGKTTRYCAKCRRMLTRISLSEFNEHAAVCEGPDKVQDKKQLKKPAPRAAPPPRVRARDLRAAKAVPAAPAAPPAGGRAPPQQQQQAYVPPPLPVHPRLTPHLEKYAEGPSQFCGLVLERSHMSEAVLETYENPDLVKELEDVTADELLELQKKCDWSDGILDRWYGWGDSKAFQTGDAMVAPLKTVVDYSERDATASRDIKPKLRYVTKSLRGGAVDPRDVIVMMACHGGLCHVQKEIGVRMAYASLSGTLKSDMDTQNPKNAILRLLLELREACVENLYRAQYLDGAKSLNSHGLIGYRNMIADQIDQHAGQYPVALSYVDMYFQRFYHIGEVLDRVWRAMDQRKLHYASVVAFLQYNRPIKFATDAEEFLFHCFSSDGQFTRETAAWMLWKYGVLRPGDGVSPSQIEKDLFPPLAPEALDEIRRSRDLIMSGGTADNSSLRSSRERGEVSFEPDDIRRSADALLHHRCN